MPLVTAAVLAFAAGLLTGFGGAFGWTAAAMLAVVVAGGREGRERIAIAGIAIGGLAVAQAEAAARAVCQAAQPAATTWAGVLVDDASPGAFVRVKQDCGLTIRAAVAAGASKGGSRVRLRGDVARGNAGPLITNATLHTVRGPDMLSIWRAAIGRG